MKLVLQVVKTIVILDVTTHVFQVVAQHANQLVLLLVQRHVETNLVLVVVLLLVLLHVLLLVM